MATGRCCSRIEQAMLRDRTRHGRLLLVGSLVGSSSESVPSVPVACLVSTVVASGAGGFVAAQSPPADGPIVAVGPSGGSIAATPAACGTPIGGGAAVAGGGAAGVVRRGAARGTS